MRIIISEEQEAMLLGMLMNESISDYCDKRLIIKKHLDDHFMRGSIPSMNADGHPVKQELVIMLGADGKPMKSMSDKQLFEYLSDTFKEIVPKEERDKFIKDTMIGWFNRDITRNGTIVRK